MTDPYDVPGQPYSGPPPTGYPPPPGPQAPGSQAQGPQVPPGYGYPPAYIAAYPPGYQPPGYQPPGYQPPGYQPAFPYGFAPVPPGERRPGTLTAAAVLAYVQAGLLILAGLILFSGSSIVDELNGSHSAELAVDGALNLLAAGLLISGAIASYSRNSIGRVLYSGGSAIVAGLTVYWLTSWNDDLTGDGLLFWGGLFASLMVVGTALLWTPDATRWLAGKRPA